MQLLACAARDVMRKFAFLARTPLGEINCAFHTRTRECLPRGAKCPQFSCSSIVKCYLPKSIQPASLLGALDLNGHYAFPRHLRQLRCYMRIVVLSCISIPRCHQRDCLENGLLQTQMQVVAETCIARIPQEPLRIARIASLGLPAYQRSVQSPQWPL